ncbi:MAG: hypothetical protein K2Y71_27495 [Xanthobacteraceae bacterium]|nr:hypothetical protein [Xanthobacteraceae bacterium]
MLPNKPRGIPRVNGRLVLSGIFSAHYLKGVSPPHVTLNQVFSGMMPYMLVVILCMVLLYLWPALALWLPTFLYGR